MGAHISGEKKIDLLMQYLLNYIHATALCSYFVTDINITQNMNYYVQIL